MMRADIKERIEQVRHGKVAGGYHHDHGYSIPEGWTIKRLSDNFTRLYRKNNSGSEKVLTISAQMGLIDQQEYYNHSYASEDKSGYYLLTKGDYAYNKSYSDGYPFGAIKRLDLYPEGIISPLYICFEPKADTCSNFWVQYFEAGCYNKEIYMVAQEGARNHGLLNIGVDDFFDGIIICPSLPEQQKIAKILTQCDKVIDLKKQLVEEKRRRKKWLMQKLLNPESGVRLPGFEEGKWVEKKVLEFGEIITGSTPSTTNALLWGTDYLWVTPTDISGKYITNTDRKLSVLGMKAERLLPAGTILVTCIASIGKNAILSMEGSCNQQINALVSAKEYSAEFLYYVFENANREFARVAGTTATPIISMSVFSRISFNVPLKLEEQTAIANVLSAADHEIDLLEQELAEWQTKKKSLMQLLLTGLVRVTA